MRSSTVHLYFTLTQLLLSCGAGSHTTGMAFGIWLWGGGRQTVHGPALGKLADGAVLVLCFCDLDSAVFILLRYSPALPFPGKEFGGEVAMAFSRNTICSYQILRTSSPALSVLCVTLQPGYGRCKLAGPGS
jgi:hypothetical protein